MGANLRTYMTDPETKYYFRSIKCTTENMPGLFWNYSNKYALPGLTGTNEDAQPALTGTNQDALWAEPIKMLPGLF